MTEPVDDLPTRVPDEGLVAWTHVIYGLHALAVLIGIVSAATIVGAFVFSVPSMIAVVLSYLKRGDAAGSFLESHYRWLIRTFWLAVLWGAVASVVAVLLAFTIIGLLIFWVPLVVVGVWLVYRVARGWLALNGARPLPL